MDDREESHSADIELAGSSPPPMPAVQPGTLHKGSPFVFGGDGRHRIGWQQLSSSKGGPSFVVLRRTVLDDLKVVEHFPLTEDGWARAWRALANLDARAAEQVLAKVAERNSKERIRVNLSRLDAQTVNYLPEVIFLGGVTPGVELTTGGRYDLRFLPDRLIVLPRRHVDALVEIPYVEIEAVNIGGVGLIKSGGGFIGGGIGVGGIIVGMAVAAALNSLTTRYTVETIVQIQAGGREIFLLHTVLEPDRLRIELSPALAAIRQAPPYPTSIPEGPNVRENSISQVEALDKLMAMFDRGLLTRDEFDHLKAKLIAES